MEDRNKKDSENQYNTNDNLMENEYDTANLSENEEIAEQMTGDIEKLRAELADQKEKYLRLYAEFDNYKRRSSKERVELIQTAGKDVIVSLLEVLDDCDRAEKQIQEAEQTPVTEGVLLVFNKLRSVLASRGVKPMDCIGKDFNPDEQEAITQIPVTDPKLSGKVIDEVVKGYYLNDKIIRFAKVVVGS
ncbi:MAG: nucleotide exchange factor GrpE [Chitinophagaceae bacterium]|nr:nucleotide exchange factor GrpE [Chitinophagaceae bacterium]MCW5927511.1 nucleotide exchange factor GrpE [Chitinophagaceae bacterium]